MERRPSLLDRLGRFVTGKGFYLVVLLCVAAMGISGWLLARSVTGALQTETASAAAAAQLTEGERTDDSAASVSGEADVSAAASVSGETVSSSATSVSEETVSSPSAVPSPSAVSEDPAASAQPAALVFTWPVNGAVIASFSMETLLYDETMLDWRTHEGVDLAASEGTRVLAAAAGTVSAIYDDELMGTTLVIDHGGGLESVYSDLGTIGNVSVGDSVYTGDIIATVGTTAPAESGRDAHLHLAMYQDGQPVDPEDYLPD